MVGNIRIYSVKHQDCKELNQTVKLYELKCLETGGHRTTTFTEQSHYATDILS